MDPPPEYLGKLGRIGEFRSVHAKCDAFSHGLEEESVGVFIGGGDDVSGAINQWMSQ